MIYTLRQWTIQLCCRTVRCEIKRAVGEDACLMIWIYFSIQNIMTFKVNERFVQPTIKSRRYHIIQMISDLGGIYALFLNISMINIVEIIILIIIRPISNCILRSPVIVPNLNILDVERPFIVRNGNFKHYQREISMK